MIKEQNHWKNAMVYDGSINIAQEYISVQWTIKKNNKDAGL